MKRVISLLLVCAMMVAAVACASPTDEDTTTTDATTEATEDGETETEGETEPDLPEYDGEGSDFSIIYRSGCGAEDYDDVFIAAESEVGEVVNDAVFVRNRMTSEKFNINIVTTGDMNTAETIQKCVTSQDDTYELGVERKSELSTITTSGYLLDFNKLENTNYTADYWDANAVEQLEFCGKLFMMPSDISMQNFTGARFLYFNKNLISDNNLADPYELIFNNEWTLDVVLEMISQVSADLNGDGKMTGEDRYGILKEDGEYNANIIYFLKGCGVMFVDKDEDNYPILTVSGDKTVEIMEKCYEVLTNSNVAISYEDAYQGFDISGYNHYFQYCRKALFTTDHFLFVQNGVDETNDFRDMESDFGFAPNPKYDSTQEDYYHGIDLFTTLLCIPSTVTDYERVGTILEYMSWASSQTVFPAYYEKTIKSKRARDDRDAQVCDMVKASICYDISDIYGWGVSALVWSGYSSQNFASTYAKRAVLIEKKIAKTADALANLDD